MDWQQTAALGLVALAVGLYVLARRRSQRAGGNCGGCCDANRKNPLRTPGRE
jgi:hypothetical protein